MTFDKGNTNLGIESAQSLEAGLRRAQGPFRFEATVYYTKFKGFIYPAADRQHLRRGRRLHCAGGTQRSDLFAGRRHFPRR